MKQLSIFDVEIQKDMEVKTQKDKQVELQREFAHLEIRKDIDFVIERLAAHQMHAFVRKGRYVEKIHAVWRKTWGLDYPYVKTARGVEICSDYRGDEPRYSEQVKEEVTNG